MLICKHPEFVWSNPPRAATLSMYVLLHKNFRRIITKGPFHRHVVPKGFRSYLRFMIVRNPYQRLFSWWKWWNKRDSRTPEQIGEFKERDFKTFLRWINYNKNRATHKFCQQQWNSQSIFADSFKAHVILKLEDCPKDFDKIPFLIPYKDKWKNEKPHRTQHDGHWTDYFDEEAIDLVHQHSEEDFERFGYLRLQKPLDRR